MYKCGITGSTGILGKNLKKNLKFKFISFNGDITKKKQVDEWIKSNNFKFIIHLAAIVPTHKVKNNYKLAKKVNFNGTKYLVDAIIKYKKKPDSFFFASTSHVYKPRKKLIKIRENTKAVPYSLYGRTKLIAEKYIKKNFSEKKINYCIGRIFSFTDLKQDQFFLVPALFHRINTNKKKIINLENLNHYRDFIAIDDIANAIKVLCYKNFKGTFNIGSGKSIHLEKIANFFSKNLKKKIYIKKTFIKPTFLISNNKKLIKTGWKPKRDFFFELKKFR
tara:strand:+ start:129 stop:959 length:831 start_codon:yes stop_codon:yes gene_type:complete